MRVRDTSGRAPAPAVTTAVRLLDALTSQRGTATLDELTDLVGVPRSSVHRVLTTLVSEGVVHRTEPRGGYRLGPRLVDWGSAYLRSVDLLDEFHRVARPIVDDLNETLQLAVLDWPDAVHAGSVDSTREVRLVTEIGRRVPAYASAAGKVLLAFRPELVARYASLTPLTAHTITSLAALRADLARIRETGLAQEMQESAENLCCLAAPVTRGTGAPAAALVICVAAASIEPAYRMALEECVRRGADELSRRLGATADGLDRGDHERTGRPADSA